MILFAITLIVLVVVCIFLCFVILIQSDKGGGISGALGGGFASASNLLGTQDTANILTKATTIAAVLFMGLCILLSLFLSNSAQKEQMSLLKKRAEQQNFSPAAALGDQGGLPLSNQTFESTKAEQTIPEPIGDVENKSSEKK